MNTVSKWSCSCVVAMGLVIAAAPSRGDQSFEGFVATTGILPSTPQLQLNLTPHAQSIMATSVDRSTERLLTVSEDKTAKVWSTSDGRLLTVLRPPVGPGPEGRLTEGALSPDGRVAAVSGYTGIQWDGATSIYIFDADTAKVIHRITGLSVLSALAFSPDGRFLAAGGASPSCLNIWRTDTWQLVKTYTGCSAVPALTWGLSFDNRGRLVTTNTDGSVRLYDQTFNEIAARKQASGQLQIGRAAISPGGEEIAMGYANSDRVDIFSGTNLAYMFSPAAYEQLDNNPHSLTTVAWSNDGNTLYAGGGSVDQNHLVFIRTWSQKGRGPGRDIPVGSVDAPGAIYGLSPLSDGRMVFGTGAPSWGVIGGAESTLHDSPVLAFIFAPNFFRISDDAKTVAFSFDGPGTRLASFSIASPAVLLRQNLPPELHAPETADGRNLVTDWWFGSAPKLNGRVLSLLSSSKSVGADLRGRTLLLGTTADLRLFDIDGNLKWAHQVEAIVQDVKLSADGRVAVAALQNGTIHWYRAADGAEILTLFPDPDGKRWIMWTPSGYYDASPGGEDLIGWSVNRAKDQAADFYPASRFHDHFYRPDVVKNILATLDESDAVRRANAASDRQEPVATSTTILTMLPPVLDLVSAPARFASDSIAIRYRVRTPADAPMLGSARIKLNGEWQSTYRARGISQVGADGSRDLVIDHLPQRDSTVEIYADNRNGSSTPLSLTVKWDGSASLAPGQQGLSANHKPRLFLLAVGISGYERPDLRLNFADNDAQQFAAAMKRQQGKEYGAVETKVITNGDATLKAVNSGLSWLENQVSGDDVGILFLAGHGFQTPDQSFYYAPADFDPAHPRETGVDYKTIRQALVKFSGAGNKAIFFIDACHSGGVLGPDLGASSGDNFAQTLSRPEYGVVVLSSSKGEQPSYEDAKWGDGAFTKALLEGIVDGKADPAQTGEITVLDLGGYVSKRVKVLTSQKQSPVLIMPSGGVDDFALATH